MSNSCEKNLAPHKAIVQVRVVTSVHPLMLTGECSGNAMPPEDLKKYGIPASVVLSVSGKDMVECVKGLKDKLAKVKEIFNE
jgi:hypothetical protein